MCRHLHECIRHLQIFLWHWNWNIVPFVCHLHVRMYPKRKQSRHPDKIQNLLVVRLSRHMHPRMGLLVRKPLAHAAVFNLPTRRLGFMVAHSERQVKSPIPVGK